MTPRARILLIIFAAFHLGLIALKALGGISKDDHVLKNTGPLRILAEAWTQVTVMQADYGFFSPVVSSDVLLEATIDFADGTSIVHPITSSNGEVALRLHASLSAFSNIPEFRELLARSHAARILDQYQAATLITIRAHDYVLPNMEAWRAGQRPGRSLMFEAAYLTERGRNQ